MKGYFIVIEGPEGSGKTSLAQELKNRLLQDYQVPSVSFKEPGAAFQGQLRDIILNKGPCEVSELMLFLADRAQNIQRNIKPALESGIWVVLDRFSDSTIIYQSLVKKVVDVETCKSLCKIAEQGVQPDYTILVNAPFSVCKERLLNRNETLRLAQQSKIDKEIWDFYQEFSHRSNLDNLFRFQNNETIDKLCDDVINTALIQAINEAKPA